MFRVVIGLAVALGSSTAFADEATARAKYDAGERAYNLGDFEKAVTLFKEAYNDLPEPAFLFNIAQTYRQAGDCKQAQFFYKRFLALKQNDAKKPLKPERMAEVEQRIAELEECIKRELAGKPPEALDSGQGKQPEPGTTPTPQNATATSPTTTTGPTTAQADMPEDDGEGEEEGQPTELGGAQPTMLSARLDAGAAKFSAGDVDTKLGFSGAVIGGYPLTLGPKLQLELGAAFTFTPVSYSMMSGDSASGSLLGVLANVAPTFTVIPKLALRLDVGVGAQVFSGIDQQGNPFTVGGVGATGALSTLHVRTAVSGDFAVTPNVVITLTPVAFGYSPPPNGFVDSISSLTTLSFLAGVGYRR